MNNALFRVLAGLVIFAFSTPNYSVSQEQPDMGGYYYDSLYADHNLYPEMPKYGQWLNNNGRNTVTWRVEVDVYPGPGQGYAVIGAFIEPEGGDLILLKDLHSNDFPAPPYYYGQHLIKTGTAVTDGSVRNRLVWLLQPSEVPPTFFRHCIVSVRYGPG
jgi:hypothetical protein